MSTRELFRRYPSTRQIPHQEFADLPTPVETFDELARQMQLASLQVKRDDLSGSLYGGNKVRKLEFLLADAQSKGHEMVWTVGGIGSHHCLATCIWARQRGMRGGVLQFPQPTTPHVQRNIRALSTTHPQVHLLATAGEMSSNVFGTRLRAWRDAHPDAYYIPGGGSSPVGVLGYVNAALELVAQIEAGEAERPDVIVVAAGTCGTLAGLHLGFALAEFDVELRGIRVVDDWIANLATVERLVRGAAEILTEAGVDTPEFDAGNLTIDPRFFGPGYGVPTEEGMAVRRLVADNEGLTLEPTYTAKTFAAIVSDVDELQQNHQRVLYWHTLSGVDLGDRIANADLDALPDEYRRWAEEPPDFDNG
jgi:D-cysteine desulfhydrase